jgi:translation initiation factor IF-2
LERNNDAPFQDDVVTNALEHGIGLLTTWDLFRLVRSFQKNGWVHEHVRELFYHSGRIEPISAHYQYVGRIAGFIEKLEVVGVQVEVGSIRRGDRVAFEMPVVFEEQIADSVEVNKQPVEEAEAGQMVGIKTSLTKEQARNGVKVYVARV